MAIFLFTACINSPNSLANKHLFLYNSSLGTIIAKYPIKQNDTFSVEFIHSVNKTPVIEYYKFDTENNIYVFKTIYYSFGAGVESTLNENETFEFGDNGEMIISNIDKLIPELTYIVGTVSDHILKINDGDEISLKNLCGQNAMITFYIK